MNLDGALADGELKRRCLVVRWDALTLDLFEAYVARGVEGVVVVLPEPELVVSREAKVRQCGLVRPVSCLTEAHATGALGCGGRVPHDAAAAHAGVFCL